ncbi:hypothetical protein BMR85_015970 [Achromobacter sp. KAs 3-5]|nr:hypothetical protein BMR85_015970 [Achromobacter sp. KAs 3-5]
MSRSGDASEQEAQRASEQVMRIPRLDPAQGFSPIPLHPVDARNAASITDPSPLANVLAAGGHPLDADTRAFMEPRFQKDFSHVRLHSDARAGASARAVQARAFTIGHHIVLGSGQYAPGTAAGQALLAHELAHVVQQSSISARGPRLLQREPSGPTYGNLPRDAPAFGSSRNVIKLQNVNGTWREVGGKYGRTARGNYDFVVKDGEIYAVKAKNTMNPLGHTEAARGGRVNWAGQVEFEAGKVKSWNDGSGHYRSLSSMRQPAVQAGLPDEKFIQHPETAVRPRPKSSLPQLPVEQPATKPRVPGEAPKVGSGPPRMAELEARYGKAPTAVPATAASTVVAEEAGSLLKVSGRTASTLGKIGSAAGWVADFLMPGPQDAIMLMVQFAMTYAEAQEAARAEGMRTGFGHGLAAGLLRLSRSWIRDNLAPKVISRSVASEVAATTGYREKGVVQGLVAGISFAERLNADQRKAMLKEGTRAMRAKGDDVTLRARWERGYTAYDIIDLSVALAPRIDEILEEARKNEELRQAAENWEKLKKYGPLMPLAPLFEQ